VTDLVAVDHFFRVSHFAIEHEVETVDMGDYIWVKLTRKSGVGLPLKTFRWLKTTPLPESSLLIDERCVGC
jgi:hypothetical protein